MWANFLHYWLGRKYPDYIEHLKGLHRYCLLVTILLISLTLHFLYSFENNCSSKFVNKVKQLRLHFDYDFI